MTTVDKAKELNVKFIGVTSHYVTEEVDAGKIIAQASFIPKWDEHELDLIYDTVFQSGCLVLLMSILSLSKTNFTKQDPTDGIIINENKILFSDALPININIHSKIMKSILI